MKPLSGSRRLLVAAGGLFLIVIAAIDVRSRWASRPAAGSEPAAVTNDGGLATDPALSADGKLLAYASDRGHAGNLDIWVRPLAHGEARRLTSGPEEECQPAFSPDGRTVAYRAGAGVYSVAAGGGEPRLIAPEGQNPRFSPDGKWLAWWVRKEDGKGEIRIAPAPGGSPRRVASTVADARFPVWSEDSRSLLFQGSDGRRWDWYVAGAAGGEPVRTGAGSILGMQGFPGRLEPQVWTRAGVLFCGRFRERQGLWSAPMSATFQCSGPSRQVSEAEASAVAQSGRTLAVAITRNRPGVWSMTRGGQVEQTPTAEAPQGWLAVSRDGGKLLYRTGTGVRLKDLGSGEERKLDGDIDGPALIGAHDRVFYRHQGSMYSIPVSGGKPERVCQHCGDPWSFSPDGNRLLFQPGWRSGAGLLYLASGERRDILRREGAERHISRAQFSPDGRWLLLQTFIPHGEREILVAPFREGASAEESEWISIAGGKYGERSPCWSQDGSMVYYISDRDGARCIWGRKTKGGEPVAIRHFHEARRSLGDGQLAAAGDKLYFVLNDSTGEIATLRY